METYTTKDKEITLYSILFAISFAHLLNDMMQSIIPSIYPIIKEKYGFTFGQIGLITLVFQMTSSLLQPLVGRVADRHPMPYALPSLPVEERKDWHNPFFKSEAMGVVR